jgi:hypothetical protein
VLLTETGDWLCPWVSDCTFFIASGLGLSALYCGHFWPIVPAPDDRWGWLWSNLWNEDLQGKPKYLKKTCPSATLSTTNHTWPDQGSNPARRGGKPVTNRLTYGAALVQCNYATHNQAPSLSQAATFPLQILLSLNDVYDNRWNIASHRNILSLIGNVLLWT